VILASPLTPLEHGLRHVLFWLHDTVGFSWAWSIIALTVIVRMIIVPLTVRQIHSMQRLQAHMPEMKAIQQRYKADKKRQNEELMKFYRENSINPASSCLPMVLQIPVFIALFYTLRHFSKHPPGGHAAVANGAFQWLHVVPNITAHATSHWSGFLLLAIYAGSQVASTLLMPSTMDKAQRTILLVMPLAFIFIVARFPAGLVLYWMTTNLWTVGQGLVTRRLMPKGPPPAPKRSSRAPAKDDGDGAAAGKQEQAKPAQQAAAASAQPRRVRRKKKGGARR
jgi:YidC/Oxa1 family membrane protein insertase